MKTITIDTDLVNIEIVPNSNSYVSAKIEIDKADIYNFFNEIDISDIIDHYGYEKLLDEIGKDDAIAYLEL